MRYPDILHHGAVSGVTGSCRQLLAAPELSFLVDCGLFQGAETSADGRVGAGRQAIGFPLGGIKALIATREHIDLVGRIPYLLAVGFQRPILCGAPSTKLLSIVLEDAFKLDASRDQKRVERYLKLIEQRIFALPYNTFFTLTDTAEVQVRVRLQCSGYILVSAYVEFDVNYRAGEKNRIVFSGDIGASHALMLPAPRSPYKADVLVIESTYGNRLHEDRRTRRQRLEQVLHHVLSNRGAVLISAFSMRRNQERLYGLKGNIHRRVAAARKPSRSGKDKETRLDWSNRNHLSFRKLLKVYSQNAQLAVVNCLAQIAGNCMCSNRRIVNYLKAMLADPRRGVLLCRLPAECTSGRQIQRFGRPSGYVGLKVSVMAFVLRCIEWAVSRFGCSV